MEDFLLIFDPWILFNALVGWICGMYIMYHAFARSNGKKPLRILASCIVLYFAVIYTLSLFGLVAELSLSEYFRPAIWLFYLIPAWEAWSDPHGKV